MTDLPILGESLVVEVRRFRADGRSLLLGLDDRRRQCRTVAFEQRRRDGAGASIWVDELERVEGVFSAGSQAASGDD